MNDQRAPSGLVYILEDDPDVRTSIEWTLESVGYEVQAFARAQNCLDKVDPSRPACFIVDLLLPGMTGLKLCQQCLAANPSFTFIMISGHGDVHSAVEAMKLGAIDFLEKPFGRERLLAVVNEAMDLSIKRRREIHEERNAKSRLQSLSPREREVLDCMGEGRPTKQIATALGISTKTVDVHRSKIMKKLEIDSPTQLAHFFYVVQRKEHVSTGRSCDFDLDYSI